MNKKYDYIFAGSGLAGLSLLYYIITNPLLQNKKILVIDKKIKNKNDKTWCFWEKEQHFYEQLVKTKWSKLKYNSPSYKTIFQLQKYEYKLISADDYYKFIIDKALELNIEFRTETILSITDIENKAVVKTELETFEANYVFNSTKLFYPKITKENTLLQHFTGWYIKTEMDCFDINVATLMDFNLPQKNEIRFMYVLPSQPNVALIELTIFGESILKKEEYELELKNYITHKLKIDSYEIIHHEFGVIPMTKVKFNSHAQNNSKIINIGTAGGYTKASTGYTFTFTQKNALKIANQLAYNQSPIPKYSFRDKMFRWYDMTLLDILLKKKMSGEEIFTMLFRKNNPERVMAFLAEESTHWDEFLIRNSVPIVPFITSGIKELFRKSNH